MTMILSYSFILIHMKINKCMQYLMNYICLFNENYEVNEI